jgi:hypothetical protein
MTVRLGYSIVLQLASLVSPRWGDRDGFVATRGSATAPPLAGFSRPVGAKSHVGNNTNFSQRAILDIVPSILRSPGGAGGAWERDSPRLCSLRHQRSASSSSSLLSFSEAEPPVLVFAPTGPDMSVRWSAAEPLVEVEIIASSPQRGETNLGRAIYFSREARNPVL